MYTFTKRKEWYDDEAWNQKLESTFFSQFSGNAATEHGNKSEITCLKALERKYPIFVSNLGFFVNSKYPWFGYSLDGIQGKDELIEIKSPVIGEELPAEQFSEKNCPCLRLIGENLELKKKHKFYGQIQLGLCVLGLKKAKLVLYSSLSDTFREFSVPYDAQFCEEFIPALRNLYFTRYLPFLYEKKQDTVNALRSFQ